MILRLKSPVSQAVPRPNYIATFALKHQPYFYFECKEKRKRPLFMANNSQLV